MAKRAHLILIARNHEGFQSISYAMREANRNITKAGKRIVCPVMTGDTLVKFFKGNKNVVATSACVQGDLGKILLEAYAGSGKLQKASCADRTLYLK